MAVCAHPANTVFGRDMRSNKRKNMAPHGENGGVVARACANKHMVLTLPALRSFRIRTRHTRLGGGVGFVLPLRARVGRTCEAFGGFELKHT